MHRSILLLLTLGALAGCVSDDPAQPPLSAVYDLPEAITGTEFVLRGDANGTQGIWVMDGIAYLSGGTGLRILDVADPQAPVLLSKETPGTESSRDVDVAWHPDGRLYAAMAAHGAVVLIDVTDPTQPFQVSEVAEGIGSAHNLAWVPNSTIVYLSNSVSRNTANDATNGGAGGFDIIDFADPEAPAVKTFYFPPAVMTPAGTPAPVAAVSCHDFTFSMERDLGFCAAVTQQHIYDISDAWNPVLLNAFKLETTSIVHGSWPAHDGNMLIIGDEFDGVVVGSPACTGATELPTAGLWFLDITDVSAPMPLAYYGLQYPALEETFRPDEFDPADPTRIPAGKTYCSVHFGDFIEDRDQVVMAWYGVGTAVIDFSDLDDIQTLALYQPEPRGSTWDAWYENGHILTGDAVGFDIVRLV